ncbi:hypothetical protein ACPOL_4316 [Acidisarcina polymorpha]|uniref:DUF3037 domain-containing protein n=1 Tax=Acidisarcina polymorpha TaxID=2211140 RepID=A0A2Z5G394_9BACT|nr:DUF3037 domain-containing protein [Acidisarcina polymorpha]AXC13591.1 hypothetical protein ACPOL_4316 [Acidisarcina polymorpha]
MQERRRCEFFLVRYVPDRVKNEFVNIGVLLREAGTVPGQPRAGGETVVRFTRNWSRVRCLDPDADIAGLEAMEADIRRRLEETGDGVRSIVSEFEDTLSNSVQLTAIKRCLAENLIAETELLMRLFVEPQKREAISRKNRRQTIVATMRRQFEVAGVWERMRKRIPVSQYTRPGDPLRIDCGYRPNGVVRLFQAVSLEADPDAAKVLAFSISAIKDGIRREEKADLELTAIVEPLGSWSSRLGGKMKETQGQGDEPEGEIDIEREEQYRFAVDTMERETIRVLTTLDLPRVAERARMEMAGQ